MRSFGIVGGLLALVVLSSCTSITGGVDFSPDKLVTDHGRFNVTRIFLGSILVVRPGGDGGLLGNRIDELQLSDAQKKKSVATKDTASLKGSFGTNASIVVKPADSAIEAQAKASIESGVTFTLTNAYRLEIASPEDCVKDNFAKLKGLVLKYRPYRLWVATFVTEGESISLDSLESVGGSLKATYPQIGTFNVDFSQASVAAFSRMVAIIGAGNAPLFISFQELRYDDAKDVILLEAIPPSDLSKIQSFQGFVD